MSTNILSIDDIICDDVDFKVREVDQTIVDEYAGVVDRLPPVEIWTDGGLIYLLDGGHRLAARLQTGLTEVRVLYFEGTREEAEARARAANLAHNAFQLTSEQRRQARLDVLLRLYEYNNKWLADDYMFCSPNTVAALRSQLEEAGRIPTLDKFKRRDGVEAKRTYDKRQPADKDELDEEVDDAEVDDDILNEEGEENERENGVDPQHDEAQSASGNPSPSGQGLMSPGPLSDEKEQRQPRQTTITLAQLGDALATEVTMYVNGEAYPLPVTLLIAEGPIAGLPETAPGYEFALVVDRAKATEMRLLT